MMRDISSGKKLLNHASDWIAVRAQAPFLMDNVTLFIEFAENRIAKPL